jgi:hypothetical protein
MSDESKKIFIDEDWKAQVERERAEAQAKQAAEPAGHAEDVDATVPEEIQGDAYFVNLVSGLAAQCMFALGMVQQEPNQKQIMIDLGHAQLLIETLTMLKAKTAGNLEPEEEGHLLEVLAELQQIYAVRAQQVQEAALRRAKIDPKELKGGPGGGAPGGFQLQ